MASAGKIECVLPRAAAAVQDRAAEPAFLFQPNDLTLRLADVPTIISTSYRLLPYFPSLLGLPMKRERRPHNSCRLYPFSILPKIRPWVILLSDPRLCCLELVLSVSGRKEVR